MKKKWYSAKRMVGMCLVGMLCISGLSGCNQSETAGSKESTERIEETQASATTETVAVNPEHTLGGTGDAKKEQAAFDAWCQEQFRDSMEDSDTLSLHYTLDYPENYDIEEKEYIPVGNPMAVFRVRGLYFWLQFLSIFQLEQFTLME